MCSEGVHGFVCLSIGLDYHFYREEIYMTQDNHCITRMSVTLVESMQLNTLRSTTGKACTIRHRHLISHAQDR